MIAMEALTEYAYRARLREITEMTVLVDASASPGEKELIKISSGNLPTVHQIEVSEQTNFFIFFHTVYISPMYKIRFQMFGGT